MIVWDPNKSIDIGEWAICGDGRLKRFYCVSNSSTGALADHLEEYLIVVFLVKEFIHPNIHFFSTEVLVSRPSTLCCK